MDFQQLKDEVDNEPNKIDLTDLPLRQISLLDNRINIISKKYANIITCNDVNSASDIYDVINRYQISNDKFYVNFYLNAFNENTINIINQLENNIYIRIIITDDINPNRLQMLLNITHLNCYFSIHGWNNIDVLDVLLNKVKIYEDCNPVVVIDKINTTTINKINNICNKIANPRFRIEINDIESLRNLYNIIPYIPGEVVFVALNDNLFNRKNPNNARELILKEENDIPLSQKKLRVVFNQIEYKSLVPVFELEKNLELIRSRIPSNASKLDIVTYVSLFIINYFKYDYKLRKENLKAKKDFRDITINQFITSGKGVCRHFASFTKYILDSLDIECDLLIDWGSKNDKGEIEYGHAFNAVKIDGEKYFLDNTWLTERVQRRKIKSLSESSDFLTSNATFDHDKYEEVIKYYQCSEYDRQEINDSVNRVTNWNNNYEIHRSALMDLFKKYFLKQKQTVTQKIEAAIPRRL